MALDMIVTTTNTIEKADIESYKGLVSVNVVVGTNVFSDFGASITDFFGGYSNTYQGKLQNIYLKAVEDLKAKAASKGANAIIGLKIDFDEISGKGKSMFMISAVGTAVSIIYTKSHAVESSLQAAGWINKEELEREVLRRRIIHTIQKGNNPSDEDWDYLFNYPIEEICEKLADLFSSLKNFSSDNLAAYIIDTKSKITRYFKLIDRHFATELLFRRYDDGDIHALELIKCNDLFSADWVINLLRKNKLDYAIGCLDIKSETYTRSDLNKMKQIVAMLHALPDTGKIEAVKSIIGKAKEKYICCNGHSNDADSEFCVYESCGKNIKGLTKFQVNQINEFSVLVDSLSELIGK